jgi:hypothetical protein
MDSKWQQYLNIQYQTHEMHITSQGESKVADALRLSTSVTVLRRSW